MAVLTEFGARKLLATENTIGQTLRIGGNQFEVIGIIQSETVRPAPSRSPTRRSTPTSP